ncbi:MAG: HD domain-containing protein [Treponema sp.]|nr:HD domain-containing protein [Treponema sp.]
MQRLSEDLPAIKQILKTDQIINIALRMLACINKEITLHSIQTAYLAAEVARQHPLNKRCSFDHLIFLALFHTLGFFREDLFFDYKPNINQIDYFSTKKSTESKYVFACYYLEFMTPLKTEAIALETFVQPFNKEMNKYLYQQEYKDVIYLCARISDFIQKQSGKPLPKNLNELSPGYFNPVYVKAFKQANQNNALIKEIKNNKYRKTLSAYIKKINFTEEENRQLQKILVQFLDFKSTSTMNHSINTASYAISLGMRVGLDSNELSTLFTSAFLHDIGKIAIPQRILEYPGRLSPKDMIIMRHHVNHSRRILNGFVSNEILNAVYRHHEKLNGKGYPKKLKSKELSLAERILTVADITSALNDSRSYKGEFSKNKTISIIGEMTKNGELAQNITKFILEDFKSLLKEQNIFRNLLSVDFSKVINSYNNYVLNDAGQIADSIISDSEPIEFEELEELEEI